MRKIILSVILITILLLSVFSIYLLPEATILGEHLVPLKLIFGKLELFSDAGELEINCMISSNFFLAFSASSFCKAASVRNDLISYNSTNNMSLSIVIFK